MFQFMIIFNLNILYYFKGISVHSVMQLERMHIQDAIAQKIQTKCALSKVNNLSSKICSEN